MNWIIYTGLILAALLLVLGVRAYLNHREIERLRSSGYGKMCFRPSNRGNVDTNFLRCMAELTLILLLLITVFGWLGHNAPR